MTWLLIMRRDLKIKYPPTYMLKFSFPHLMKTDTMPMTSATMAQMRTHWGSLRKYEGYWSGSQSCFHSIFPHIYAFWVYHATRKWNQFKPCSFPSLLECQRPTVTVSQAHRSHHHQQLWDHLGNWKATTGQDGEAGNIICNRRHPRLPRWNLKSDLTLILSKKPDITTCGDKIKEMWTTLFNNELEQQSLLHVSWQVGGLYLYPV